MRVAIVGGPGVGKSTLLRQLGDLYHNGSYGEGEKGVWDPRVLADIEAGRNPVGVTAYFAWLYDANYQDAGRSDGPGRVVFFEGAQITLEAHIAEYPEEHHAELRRVLAIGDGWSPGRVIVLTSSSDTIEKHIRRRNRPHESVERMVQRFRLIDGEFRRLAPQYPNTIVIDRDNMNSTISRHSPARNPVAGLPMFREIPYERLDRGAWFNPLTSHRTEQGKLIPESYGCVRRSVTLFTHHGSARNILLFRSVLKTVPAARRLPSLVREVLFAYMSCWCSVSRRYVLQFLRLNWSDRRNSGIVLFPIAIRMSFPVRWRSAS